jgi:signal transduction histidine kinase
MNKTKLYWLFSVIILVILISILHYTTPTMHWQYHLIYMQCYFIPILIGAFQFGVRGGLMTAIMVSIIYLPHVMLQWGGLIETNLMRFMQILLFNILGYLTGLMASRARAEKERFQKTAQELEINLQKLKEQSENLIELEEQLRLNDRLAVVGELTASLAHEVRNPLGSIRGAVEIIQEEVPESKLKSEFFQILIDETSRLNSVVENYLTFSSRKKQKIERYDVREIIHNTSMMLSNKAQKKEIEIQVELPEVPINLKGDPNELWQILMNLLINSIQAMRLPGKILIKAELEQKILEITIRDEGVGIPIEAVEKLYTPFYTTKAEGTGLGLAIVKRIVDENKWKIKHTSNPKAGTTFLIEIPLNS